jgi:alkylresorcinol/alkylpyrone synthase
VSGIGRAPVARVTGIGTATGRHPIEQDDAKRLAASLFSGSIEPAALERHLSVFDHAGVRSRQLSVPPGWFLEPHGFAERNRTWSTAAVDLATRAGHDALERSGRRADEVDALVVLATTGVSTPSIDTDLIETLGLRRSGTSHVTVFGRGCAGGAVGLGHAARLAAAAPGSVVLAIAVEVCSVVRSRTDLALTDLVGAALFADGAAAVVITTDGDGPAVLGSSSDLIPDTRGAMGWDVTDGGFGLVLDRNVPGIVRRHLAPSVRSACRALELEPGDLDTVVAHPGSARVMDAAERALELEANALDDSRGVLADHGNMSAPTVWFVLERALARRPSSPRGSVTALLTGMGPGFSIEHVVLRW